MNLSPVDTTESLSFLTTISSMDRDTAETLAGPFFGLSLFPYLGFLYFLNVTQNNTPKGVVVGFWTCLLFVFLTIPAAITAQLWYGVSLADCDWLHGSAESLLTITNLVTVIAFRQALSAQERQVPVSSETSSSSLGQQVWMPKSATRYAPMVYLVAILTALAGVTALVPAFMDSTSIHTPYLNGFLNLPTGLENLSMEILGARPEPENALSISCWIIHVSSLVEFLVAMGFCWRWADVVQNQKWKGLTWGLLPLHSSGITACTYHLLYNRLAILVPFQAFLTCVGNTTAAYAAYRIAISNGWVFDLPEFLAGWGIGGNEIEEGLQEKSWTKQQGEGATVLVTSSTGNQASQVEKVPSSFYGFEDLGQVLSADDDYSFLFKLFLGCTLASYVIKYGTTFFDFPYECDAGFGFLIIFIPSLLNAFKWYKRSRDATFEGWF